MSNPTAFRTSEDVKEIAPALAKAYGAMKAATKDATNPHFNSRYADIAAVDEAIRPALTENQVFVLQTVSRSESLGLIVVTRLMHATGQWIESDCIYVEPAKATSQQHGSAQTYARRYGLMMAVGLPVDDDDGNAATTAQERVQQRDPRRRDTAPAQQFTGPTKRQAQYNGRTPCKLCGEQIVAGQWIAYAQGKAVVHWDCYEVAKADRDAAQADAQRPDAPAIPADDDLPNFDKQTKDGGTKT